MPFVQCLQAFGGDLRQPQLSRILPRISSRADPLADARGSETILQTLENPSFRAATVRESVRFFHGSLTERLAGSAEALFGSGYAGLGSRSADPLLRVVVRQRAPQKLREVVLQLGMR